MSPDEQKDLDVLKAAIADLKRAGFDGAQMCLQMANSTLPHTGYKSREEAAIGTLKSYMRDIKSLEKAYLKKYPD
jgi:hypothetical protein